MIRRFIGWFDDFGIPVGGVVVNGVIRTDDPQSAPEFVRNRMRMQEGYLRQIHEEFDGQVRAVMPYYDDDVRGVRRLTQTADGLFA